MLDKGNVLVAFGGGPTAVINETLVGVVLECRFRVRNVYGAKNGVKGIIGQEFVDLTRETNHNLELVAGTPSAALGSTRMKPDAEDCEQMLRVMRAHNIRHFFYIGGNDSAETTRIIAESAAVIGYDLRCIHLPKTVDCDLVQNDHTPGYGSAARYVAKYFLGGNRDNWALPGIYIVVTMGRHAGFLAASAALGKQFPDDGPHIIGLPERPFVLDRFLGQVDDAMRKYGRCVVAVSEGIHEGDGVPITAKLAQHQEIDAHGNQQLAGTGVLGDWLFHQVKTRTSYSRVRVETLGYGQRSYPDRSDVDAREAREVGEKGVQFALGDNQNGSVTIVRTGPYTVDFGLERLEAVAGLTRTMPPEYLTECGTNVTDAFHIFVRPLLGSGMPHMYRLRENPVPKIDLDRMFV
jgi:6-phosphofructokinase 1